MTVKSKRSIGAEGARGLDFAGQSSRESPVEPGRRQALSKDRRDVAILTGGWDKPYALGLGSAIMAQGISFDFIGSDDVDGPELHETGQVNVLNLRGDQSSDASKGQKVLRVLRYYARLIIYAAKSKPKIFHILWNNKFEVFDRTLLMLYYKLLGKRIVFTAHNVNAGKRDGRDNWLNLITLKTQYSLADHIFVHTEKMKGELVSEFDVPATKIGLIPFGINNTIPNSKLTSLDAKIELGLNGAEKTLLFFGNITPYKGLEYLIAALDDLTRKGNDCRLIIAGRPKIGSEYWMGIKEAISRKGLGNRIIERSEYIGDDKVELYFKAADVLVLPYTHIFQSGVLFLGYSFGLPVIVADVGSLKEDVVEGKTGFVFRPKDPGDLAARITTYFSSDLFQQLNHRRSEIRAYANERYSWAKVGAITQSVYARLLKS